ncbi:hypothetical protein [Martelella soudanensis]|uniref:hypothetical protein n=1 Tax=unclassified Martelella TaxID=2629616 RepID=UPI0015DDC4F9|nr:MULTISPECIES: hypothetical protein [unclassified Martelella]
MFELHRETLHDKTIRIVPDPDPMNPRVECDTLGTMICWHPRYNLGDKHRYSAPSRASCSEIGR